MLYFFEIFWRVETESLELNAVHLKLTQVKAMSVKFAYCCLSNFLYSVCISLIQIAGHLYFHMLHSNLHLYCIIKQEYDLKSYASYHLKQYHLLTQELSFQLFYENEIKCLSLNGSFYIKVLRAKISVFQQTQLFEN